MFAVVGNVLLCDENGTKEKGKKYESRETKSAGREEGVELRLLGCARAIRSENGRGTNQEAQRYEEIKCRP